MGHFYLPLIISFGVKKLWEEWNIRGAILFSLWLQTLLILVAPFRKSTREQWLIWLIWSAYLLADEAAIFAIGLISNSQRDQYNNPESKSKERRYLLAFWAPFLLLHLGGPDSITAFALEDNQLWKRHLLLLLYQTATVFYVFCQSLPNVNLWSPTALVFIAGIIKYVERTVALYLANLNNFRNSMLKQPDPGVNYATIMAEYASKGVTELPSGLNRMSELNKDVRASDGSMEPVDNLGVVHKAYIAFQLFKGLVVDLIFSFSELNESQNFFNRLTAESALRTIEVELNFLYGTFYTKMEVVFSVVGCIFRLIAFVSILVTLGLFHFHAKKDEFHRVDIKITYALLLGAIALDVISFLKIIFSDRTFASIKDQNHLLRWPIVALFKMFLALRKPWWHPCKCKINNSGHQESGDEHHVLVTPLAFRRWSGIVSAHNLIRYCLKSSPTTIHEFPSLCEVMFEKIMCVSKNKKGCNMISQFNALVTKINCWTGNNKKFGDYMTKIKRKILQFNPFVAKATSFWRPVKENVSKLIPDSIKDLVDKMKYVSYEPFIKELWEFIFDELKNKSEFATTPEIAKRISSARGDWVLENATSEFIRSKLLKYVTEFPYDESLLVWHIATDLCYYTDDEKVINEGDSKDKMLHREFSKILSDYMLYLLVFQPTMMSVVADIGKIRYRHTCAEAEKFFQKLCLAPNDNKKACEEILSVYTDVKPLIVKTTKGKSVLFDASMLANDLKRIEAEAGEEKWKLMSRVWVELISYAAIRCAATTHAQQLGYGGELITFFWLLAAHFGLGEHFEVKDGHARAKFYGKARKHHLF